MHAFLNNRLVVNSKTSLSGTSSTASWANEGSDLQTIDIPWVCNQSDEAAPAKAQMLVRDGVAQKIIIHCGCGQSLEVNLSENN